MIYNKFIKQCVVLFTFILISACGGGSDGGDDGPSTQNPEPAILVFPIQNSECNEGIVISSTQSRVTFEWNAAANTQLYTLKVENLLDNTSTDFPANSTSKEVTLERGTPYSWSVVSKSNNTPNTATSESWRFYNAGEGIENYAPFPATLVSPEMSSATSTSLALSWNGGDIDNDITNYEVYLGTTNPPETLEESTSNTSISISDLTGSTTYYWQVVTNDDHGNNSTSAVFEFITQ